MDNSITPLSGVAVSLDICNSTSILEEFRDEFLIHEVVDKVYKAINYSLCNSSGQLVRYTGDGALIFFRDSIAISSTDNAINFAINFINIWKRCSNWFSSLSKLKFRVCLDRGQVMTNSDGGLWSGLTLNRASKMRTSNNLYECRVTVSKSVVDSIMKDSFYFNLFKETGICTIGKTNIKLYNITFDDIEETTQLPKCVKTVPICLCIIGIGTSISRIKCVLSSINHQTLLPKMVFLATTITDKINENYNFNLKIIAEENLERIERAFVRNNLMQHALQYESMEMICFLDGDTIISSSCIEIAYNLFKSENNCVISLPRIDFDVPLDDIEVKKISAYFLNHDKSFHLNQYLYGGSITLGNLDSYAFLGSYVLFVPTQIVNKIGLWDTNFKSWGEEDIDFTYRIFSKGYRLLIPQIKGFLSLHLSHDIIEDTNFLENAKYLLSKYPDLKSYRKQFYALLGFI